MRRAGALWALCLLVCGCNGSSPGNEEPRSIRIVRGNGQTSAAELPVVYMPTVRVVDEGGRPRPGVPVRFQVRAGGGSVAPDTETTNALGEAATEWTLGPISGANEFEASVEGEAGAAVTFTATGSGPLPPCTPAGAAAAIQEAEVRATLTSLTALPERASAAGQLAAAALLEERLLSSGARARRFDVPWNGATGRTLVVDMPGTAAPAEIWAAGAHYDAVEGSPGAEDDGTGTAAVVELARVLSGCRGARTFRFLLFFGEESGRVGSTSYASAAARRGDDIRGYVNVDMVGAPHADGSFTVGPGQDPLATAVMEAANRWVGDPLAVLTNDTGCA